MTPTIAEALAMPVITASILKTRTALIGNGVEVAVACTRGSDRVAALGYLAQALNDPSFVTRPLASAGVGVNMATAALLELYEVVAPEDSLPPMGAPVAQPQQPNFLDQARAAREAAKEEKEMSTADVKRRMKLLHDKFTVQCPPLGGMLCASQLRALHEEVVRDERIPAHKNLEIDRLLLWDGVDGVAPGRPKKDEEQVAADATDAQEFRIRVEAYVHSIGLVTVGEAAGDKTYHAALQMGHALKRATNLVTLTQLRGALRSALVKARRLCNQHADAASIADGYLSAAAEIQRRNDDAADATPATQSTSATPAAGTLTYPAPADWTKMIADAVAKAVPKGAASGSPIKKKQEKNIKLPNGTYKAFERKKGGNPECPVACPLTTTRTPFASTTTRTSKRERAPRAQGGWERTLTGRPAQPGASAHGPSADMNRSGKEG